jgi:hypothetical protein
MQRGAKNFDSKPEKLWHVSLALTLKFTTKSLLIFHITLAHPFLFVFAIRVKPNKQTYSDMKANNYEVAEAGETITFRGLVARSTSQAFFLTFCTALGMASLALVLQIQFQDLG